MILDFHTHTFPDKIAKKVVDNLAKVSLTVPFTDGSVAGLAASMKEAGYDYSLNLPVMTSPEQVEKINSSLIASKEELQSMGILTFGGLHPDYPHKKEELIRLRDAGIRGVKIHPAYQKADLDDPRMMEILSLASEQDMIVITHAGIDIGIYDHDYASVKHILKILKEVQPTKLVLAHMGGWACWDDVERDLAGAPVYLDTAFSLGKIMPLCDAAKAPYRLHNLTTEDFTRLVRKHGTDKVLYATDCPWGNQKAVLDDFLKCPFTKEEQQAILYQNGAHLLPL